MKKLRISATFTAVLGFLSVLSLIFLFLALSDIAQHEEDLTLEWHTTGICIIILSAFTISTFITLGFLNQMVCTPEQALDSKNGASIEELDLSFASAEALREGGLNLQESGRIQVLLSGARRISNDYDPKILFRSFI